MRKPKKIVILGNTFDMVYDKSHNGGSFDFANCRIEIGIKSAGTDPLYVLTIVSHEVMEAILECMGARYNHPRISHNYLFNFNHQTFENAIQIHTEIMSKFYDSSL